MDHNTLLDLIRDYPSIGVEREGMGGGVALGRKPDSFPLSGHLPIGVTYLLPENTLNETETKPNECMRQCNESRQRRLKKQRFIHTLTEQPEATPNQFALVGLPERGREGVKARNMREYEGVRPSGHADKEVMAATVLTTLSTSPLVLNPSSSASDLASKGWKESLSASYSSSTSGNWSWDASDQSVPSTPSPPLSNDAGKSFLLSSQSDDNNEDTESTHFLFEDPIPRKRKNSMKVMFKCLWKNCEKVLSTSSGIQRHIRTVHLGRNGDSDYSDGEEDFYYSEIEVNMDTLSEGLSNLTPTSPTTSGPAPVFPVLTCDASRSEPARMIHTPLSQSAPSALCHIRTDHAYQATTPVSIPSMPSEPPHSEDRISVSWQSPPVIYKGLPGPMTQIRTVSIGEKRQPVNHTTVSKAHTNNTSASKATTGTRKPRGEAKKCRKVYGMEKRDLWCTACRWKKACQRFTD
ncbi:unnamed protein product [Leuciscus chuanchicus]